MLSQQTMKIIISGGGTGGHIYPAIAVANALKEQKLATDILFVGAIGKMEMQKVPAAGYPIIGLSIRGFQRKKLFPNLFLPFSLIQSLWQARNILKKFRPDVVLGTGGYASSPVVYMAAKRKIPTLIQEQNAAVGLANKVLGRYVNKVCVAYAHMKQYFPADKIVLTGTPVRQDILHLTDKKQAAYKYFGLTADKKCLLILGGSLGAKTINESILQAVDQLIEAGVQLIWPTGSFYFERIQTQLSPQQRTFVKVYPFIERMDLTYAAADVVISRAGALAIAELSIAQKPVIFVPSPNVVADHQTHNVLPLVKQNAALMVEDKEARQTLAHKAIQLLNDTAQQKLLAENIKAWARPQATAAIVEEMTRLAHTVPSLGQHLRVY